MELNIPSTLRIGNVYSNLGKEGDIYDFTLKIVGLKDGASLRITKGVGSGGTLEVSSSGGRFDRIAFKNLAIYPRILSKDDCIKAYN